MMQRFAFLVFAASVALLGSVIPVEGAATVVKRETNGQRFARGLPPLAPVRRSKTETAKRKRTSSTPASTAPPIGRLEVRWAINDTRIGYVSNDAKLGPIGLNLDTDLKPVYPDLRVEFSGLSLLAKDPEFAPPHYIGGNGTDPLSPQNANTIEFINVSAGPYADIWTLDKISWALNATWTNPDKTQVKPTLIYDPLLNALNFTSNPDGVWDHPQYPVTIFFVQ